MERLESGLGQEPKVKITADTLAGPSDLALLLGVTGRNIRQLAEDGVLEKAGRGAYNLCDSVQRYVAYKSGRSPALADEDEAQLDIEKKRADVEYKRSKAKIATLEADEMEGRMHRSEDVAAMTEDLVFAVRGALMALPGRLAVDVTAVETPAEASEVIKREVYAVMGEIAQYRYDPKQYAERVRERRKLDAAAQEDGEET